MSAASRTPDQITADIAETRERLAATIDQLVYRASPKTIANRQVSRIKGAFVGADGSVNVQNVGKVAGGVVGLVLLVVLIRKVTG